MAGCCSEIEQTDVRNRAKGLLKVMSSFVTVGGEKNIRWDSALSVRPEMRDGDREAWRKRRGSNKGDDGKNKRTQTVLKV